MTYGLIVRKAAENDIQDAYNFYESCRPGLGHDFLLSVDVAFARLCRRPDQFPTIYRNIRRIALYRFPYSVFFITGNNVVVVIAVLHARRDPENWQVRLET